MTLELVPDRTAAWRANLDPMLRVLLDCARTRMTLERLARIRATPMSAADAERLLQLASFHLMVPLLQHHLAGGGELPAHVAERLKRMALERSELNGALYSELHDLLDDLDAAAIPVIPFRGPVLGASLYGNVGLREFRELDLLVRRQDVLRLKSVLGQRGYAPEYRLSRAAERIHLKEATDYTFERRRGRGIVEVHWALLPKYLSTPLERSCWEHLVPRTLGHRQVRSLSARDLLIFLCAHGAKHAWDRLIWVTDVAECVRTDAALDWDQLLLQARAVRSERAVRLGLLLAREWLDAPVPDEIAAELLADASLVRLARSVTASWQYGRPRRASAVGWFHLATRDGWLDRLRYVALRATNLNANDWRFMALPEALMGLYYPLRLVRLAGEAVSRIAPAPKAAGLER